MVNNGCTIFNIIFSDDTSQVSIVHDIFVLSDTFLQCMEFKMKETITLIIRLIVNTVFIINYFDDEDLIR